MGLVQISTHRAAVKRWPFGAASSALFITLAFTLMRILICPLVGLGTNEAYAIASGRLMSLSYFDHPPLHFWLAHVGAMLFGDTRMARLPFIALGGGTSWLMFALTRRFYGAQAGVWATLALNLSVFFSLESGNWILPDGPLNFFLLAAAIVLAPLAQDKRLDPWQWLAAGAFVGLAALSKYHALAFAGGLFCYLLTSRERRKSLGTAGPWLAALSALLVFSPVLFWNADHDWISLRFQGARAEGHHLDAGVFLGLLAAQFALISPWVAIPLIRGLTSERTLAREPTPFLLWLGLPSAIAFSLVPLWSDGGMVQWPMPGWLLLVPLAGKYLADQAPKNCIFRHWTAISLSLFLLFAVITIVEIRTGWLAADLPGIFKRGDPTAEYVEWRPLALIVNRVGRMDASRDFVVTSGWRDAAKIDQGLAGRYRLIVASKDPRNFAVGLNSTNFEGRDGWIVLRAQVPTATKVAIRNCFRSTGSAPPAEIVRSGRPDARLVIWRGENFLPQECKIRTFKE